MVVRASFMADTRDCSHAVLQARRLAPPPSAPPPVGITMADQPGDAPFGRRAALRLVAAGISGPALANSVLAEGKPAKTRPPIPSPGNPYGDEENGLWLPGLIPIPTVTNKINNPVTGTRSFVQLGVYVANIGPEGSAYRIKQNAFDLLGWGDLLGKNAWNYLKKYLQLKSTIMYFDFDTVITGASDEEKQSLTDLANRLFSNFEKVCIQRVGGMRVPVFLLYFDGNLHIKDYLHWEQLVDTFFDYFKGSLEQQVKYIACKLKGGAGAWWLQFLQKGVEKAKEALKIGA